jgi:hypothetical protein
MWSPLRYDRKITVAAAEYLADTHVYFHTVVR